MKLCTYLYCIPKFRYLQQLKKYNYMVSIFKPTKNISHTLPMSRLEIAKNIYIKIIPFYPGRCVANFDIDSG